MNSEPEVRTVELFKDEHDTGWGGMYGLELSDDITSCPYGDQTETEDSTFVNAATCPDCSGGMISQGRCHFCPECGYESCYVT